MRACRSCWALLALITVFLSANFLQAETIALTAVDRGAYGQNIYDTGFHDSSTKSYLAGRWDSGGFLSESRNFFVFDLTDYADREILSASLEVNTLGIVGGSQTFMLYAVTTSAPDLASGTSGEAAIYADLGDGTSYGSRDIQTTEASTTISIDLNPAFILDANEASDLLVLGGALALESGTNEQYAFYTNGEMPLASSQLILEVASVPEPSTLLLAILGLAGLLAFRRR